MARITARVSVAKAKVRSFGEGLSIQVLEVIWTIPETSRSMPGQSEVSRKGDGGSLPVLILFVRVTWV